MNIQVLSSGEGQSLEALFVAISTRIVAKLYRERRAPRNHVREWGKMRKIKDKRHKIRKWGYVRLWRMVMMMHIYIV